MRRIRRLLMLERLETRDTPAVILDIPDNLTGVPGGQVTMPVDVDNAAGIQGAEFSLKYDTTLLDATNGSVRAGSAWPAGNTEVVANVDDAAGTIVVFVFSTEGLPAGAGSLLDVQFAISSSAPTGSVTTLDLTQARLNEGAILPIPAAQPGADPTDGQLTINAAQGSSRISGTVFADTNGNGTPDPFEGVPLVRITLVDSSTGVRREAVTDDAGNYEFTNVAAGNYQILEQQPVALLDGGSNQLAVSIVAGENKPDQNFRELGLRAAFVPNRLLSTTVQPVGSPAWNSEMRRIVSAADEPSGSSVAPATLASPAFASVAAPFGVADDAPQPPESFVDVVSSPSSTNEGGEGEATPSPVPLSNVSRMSTEPAVQPATEAWPSNIASTHLADAVASEPLASAKKTGTPVLVLQAIEPASIEISTSDNDLGRDAGNKVEPDVGDESWSSV